MTADDVRGEDYEATKPVPARTRVAGDPWVRDDGYWEAYNSGYDAALANHVCAEISERHDSEFLRGVQAARDAVADVYVTTEDGTILRQGGSWENALDHALAAIDALRGES